METVPEEESSKTLQQVSVQPSESRQLSGELEEPEKGNEKHDEHDEPVDEDPTTLKLAELLEETLVAKDHKPVRAKEVLKDKIIAFYFSAFWSPPCKDFVKLLAEFHKEMVKRGAPFEVVFVSCDSSEEEMFTYFATMHGDWWALPYDSKLRVELRAIYDITMVPKLLVVKPNGKVITQKGRKEVTDKRLTAFFSWYEHSGIKTFSPSKYNMFQIGIMEDEDRKARALLREADSKAPVS